jgi:hypothetical protein
MTRPSRRPLKHLGALHGSGVVSIENGQQSLGLVSYEIDGYLDRTTRSASGQIEGAVSVLAQAFRAGGASLALSNGPSVDIVLSDPQGGPTAEVDVSGAFPL